MNWMLVSEPSVIAIGGYKNNRFWRDTDYFRGCGENKSLIHVRHFAKLQQISEKYACLHQNASVDSLMFIGSDDVRSTITVH